MKRQIVQTIDVEEGADITMLVGAIEGMVEDAHLFGVTVATWVCDVYPDAPFRYGAED